MNNMLELRQEILNVIATAVQLKAADLKHVTIKLNVDKQSSFGDMSCNAAMVLAKMLKKNPRELAQTIIDALLANKDGLLAHAIEKIEIAGPGFPAPPIAQAMPQPPPRQSDQRRYLLR